MTKEQQFFLQVLADHLNKRETLPPDGLNWQQLYSYAKSHQVQAIFGHQCKSFLSEHEELISIKKSFEMDAIKSVYSYANNINAYHEMQEVFKKNHVRFFPVKGLEVARLYPIPAFRTMGDLDIIVQQEGRNRIFNDMTQIGYKLKKDDYEQIYYRKCVHIEVHDHLVYKQNQENSKIYRFFDDIWTYVNKDADGNDKLDWNYHFIFLIQHIKKHFHGNGIGFRQFMDIAVTAKSITDMDWNTIEANLKKIGLWDFTQRVFEFCEKWFDIDMPVKVKALDNDLYEESTEFVFKNGVFGFDNEHHKEHAIERRMRASNLPPILSKLKMIIKAVFIPYRYMIKLPYCSFLKGKKYLLPIAWFYRIHYVVRNKRSQLEDEQKLLFESNDIILQHKTLMKKWGL